MLFLGFNLSNILINTRPANQYVLGPRILYLPQWITESNFLLGFLLAELWALTVKKVVKDGVTYPFMKGSIKKDKWGFWVGKRKMRKYEREGKPHPFPGTWLCYNSWRMKRPCLLFRFTFFLSGMRHGRQNVN